MDSIRNAGLVNQEASIVFTRKMHGEQLSVLGKRMPGLYKKRLTRSKRNWGSLPTIPLLWPHHSLKPDKAIFKIMFHPLKEPTLPWKEDPTGLGLTYFLHLTQADRQGLTWPIHRKQYWQKMVSRSTVRQAYSTTSHPIHPWQIRKIGTLRCGFCHSRQFKIN